MTKQKIIELAKKIYLTENEIKSILLEGIPEVANHHFEDFMAYLYAHKDEIINSICNDWIDNKGMVAE